MRRMLELCLPLLLAGMCEANSVAWGEYYIDRFNGLKTVRDGENIPSGSFYYFNVEDDSIPYFYVSAAIGIDVDENNIVLKAMDAHVLWWGTTLVLADIGDVVDYDTTVGCDEVFYSYYCKGDGTSEEVLSDYDIVLSNLAEQVVYFGFAVNITRHDLPSFLYGWIGLTVTPGGFSMYGASINLSGGPMVVGAIPEPSCAALLLLGLAPLALRRRIC